MAQSQIKNVEVSTFEKWLSINKNVDIKEFLSFTQERQRILRVNYCDYVKNCLAKFHLKPFQFWQVALSENCYIYSVKDYNTEE